MLDPEHIDELFANAMDGLQGKAAELHRLKELADELIMKIDKLAESLREEFMAKLTAIEEVNEDSDTSELTNHFSRKDNGND